MRTRAKTRPYRPLQLARLVRHAPTAGAVVASVGVGLLWLGQDPGSGVPAPGLVWMCFNVAVFTSAALMLCRWKFLSDPGSAWCAASLLCVGAYFQGLLAAGATAWSAPLSLVDLVALAAIVWMVRSGARQVPPTGWRHPVPGGIGIGLALAGARLVLDVAIPALPTWLTFVAVAAAFPVAIAVGGAAMLAMDHVPSAHRWSVTVIGSVGLFSYHILPNAPLTRPVVGIAVAAVVVTCCVLLVAVSVRMLQDAYLCHARRMVELSDRASDAEATAHRDADLLHELRATIAGVDTATRLLMHDDTAMPPERRESLRRMLEAELTRLRVIAAADICVPDEPQVVDVDRVLEPVVVAHRVQGARIEMPATGIRARCSALEVATAVNVLLTNARKHAAGAHVWIEWELDHDRATIRIRDDGPGVPDDVRTVLFGRRVKGSQSNGHGLGLCSARQGIRKHGGDLTLETTTQGTSFALVLPQ